MSTPTHLNLTTAYDYTNAVSYYLRLCTERFTAFVKAKDQGDLAAATQQWERLVDFSAQATAHYGQMFQLFPESPYTSKVREAVLEGQYLVITAQGRLLDLQIAAKTGPVLAFTHGLHQEG